MKIIIVAVATSLLTILSLTNDSEARTRRHRVVQPVQQVQQEETSIFSFFTRAAQPAATSVTSKAESMIGMSARGNRRELTRKFSSTYGHRVDPGFVAWCAAFANTVLAESGLKTTGSLMAKSFISWGRPTQAPKQGDIVVLNRGKSSRSGHVGFFYGFVNHAGVRKVAVLGGNQSRQVKVSYFPVYKVASFRTAS